MCLLEPSRDSYIPMVTPVTFCSGDVSPTLALGLPSSCQGNLWLLDYHPDTEGEAPRCRPGTCTAGGAPWSCREPCDPAAANTMTRGAWDAVSRGPRPPLGPGAPTTGHTAQVCALGPHTPAGRQALPKGPQGLGRLSSAPKSFRPLPHCRPSGVGYRSYQTWGFPPGGFSSLCCFASGRPSQNYRARNWLFPRCRPTSCSPRSYFSGNLGGLSSLPSSFPPLRYLRPGCY